MGGPKSLVYLKSFSEQQEEELVGAVMAVGRSSVSGRGCGVSVVT